MEEEIAVFIGSGNVFADLGLPNPEERQLKARLSLAIEDAIKDKRLTRKQAAQQIGLSQQDLADVIAGRLSGFSVGQLVHCLHQLDRDVELSVSVRARESEPKELEQEKERQAVAA